MMATKSSLGSCFQKMFLKIIFESIENIIKNS